MLNIHISDYVTNCRYKQMIVNNYITLCKVQISVCFMCVSIYDLFT